MVINHLLTGMILQVGRAMPSTPQDAHGALWLAGRLPSPEEVEAWYFLEVSYPLKMENTLYST